MTTSNAGSISQKIEDKHFSDSFKGLGKTRNKRFTYHLRFIFNLASAVLIASMGLTMTSCAVSQEKSAMIGTVAGAAAGVGLAQLTGASDAQTVLAGLGGGVAGNRLGKRNGNPDVVKVRRGQ